MTILPNIIVDFSGQDYLLPYFERQFPKPVTAEQEAAAAPRYGVRIVTAGSEDNIDRAVDAYCAEHNLPLSVLRCPAIVCTGMTGLPRRIAAGIYRGTYCHIRGNEARISVVHAVDVARAASLCQGLEVDATLTDGTDPTVHDLAEALSYRLGDKRLMTLVPKWARWWYGKKYYAELTSDHTAESTFAGLFPDFKAVAVTQYLRTHVYDEESL